MQGSGIRRPIAEGVTQEQFTKHLYTAVSTKVVPRKCKTVRDNANWHYG